MTKSENNTSPPKVVPILVPTFHHHPLRIIRRQDSSSSSSTNTSPSHEDNHNGQDGDVHFRYFSLSANQADGSHYAHEDDEDSVNTQETERSFRFTTESHPHDIIVGAILGDMMM